MKDTLRILVSWQCNLSCAYCCNKQERFRKDIIPTAFESIDWAAYENFCVTGGEPLMSMDKVRKVLAKVPQGKTIILYSNGILLSPALAKELSVRRVKYMNVGLHGQEMHYFVISHVLRCLAGTKIQVRFHAQDIYKDTLEKEFPGVNFRFWKMDDCDRANEDRIVLTN